MSRTRSTAAIATVAVAGLVVTGAGVYALLSATAFNMTPQAVGSGTMSLTLSNGVGALETAVAGMAPGDVVNRHVTLTNGSIAGEALSLQVQDLEATPTVLSTDATRGLQLKVTECAVPWTTAGVCGGATTVLLDRALAGFTAASQLGDGLMAANASRYLQLQVRLADSTETTVNGVPQIGGVDATTTTVQGRTAQLRWTFTEGQRAGTVTNS